MLIFADSVLFVIYRQYFWCCLQTARSVLQNNETVSQMIEDLADVDFEEICHQAGYVEPEHAQIKKDVIFECALAYFECKLFIRR